MASRKSFELQAAKLDHKCSRIPCTLLPIAFKISRSISHCVKSSCAYFYNTRRCSHCSCETRSLCRCLQAPEVLEPMIGTIKSHACVFMAYLTVPMPSEHAEGDCKIANWYCASSFRAVLYLVELVLLVILSAAAAAVCGQAPDDHGTLHTSDRSTDDETGQPSLHDQIAATACWLPSHNAARPCCPR
jgi:hypothetical protein